jgi:hypothetical protein
VNRRSLLCCGCLPADDAVFRRQSEGDDQVGQAASAEQAASLAALEAGGLPLRAEQRLAEMSAGGLFTSDLSVNEFALWSSRVHRDVEDRVEDIQVVVQRARILPPRPPLHRHEAPAQANRRARPADAFPAVQGGVVASLPAGPRPARQAAPAAADPEARPAGSALKSPWLLRSVQPPPVSRAGR